VLADAIMEMFRLPDIHTSSAVLIRQENGVHDVPTVTHDVEPSILRSLEIHARKPEKAPIPYRNLNFAYRQHASHPTKRLRYFRASSAASKLNYYWPVLCEMSNVVGAANLP
jgi:hypothetical protein